MFQNDKPKKTTRKPSKRESYPQEFKTEAVKLADSVGTTQAARELKLQTSQCCSKRFQKQLKAAGLLSSMSDKGECYDNACAESFFHSLKVEAIHGEDIKTREQMRSAVFEYIELDYNRIRHHSSIGNKSPINYEMAKAA